MCKLWTNKNSKLITPNFENDLKLFLNLILLTIGSIAAEARDIHVGDRLLAINDMPLQGKGLSEVVQLLQGRESIIKLKLSRRKDQTTFNSDKGK